MARKLICPECEETVERGTPRGSRTGYALQVEPKRLEHRHTDREPLCPVVTATGYQPALPTRA
jgi:hypothetical protein